jgi:hypothetical protein
MKINQLLEKPHLYLARLHPPDLVLAPLPVELKLRQNGAI